MATYTAAIAALTDITAGQTLADAGHAARHNEGNEASRELAAFLDVLAAATVTTVNGASGAVTLAAADVGAVPDTAGIVYREYDPVTGWPERGTVASGTIVMWVKRTAADPDPTIDATYALAGVDIGLLAQA